MTLLYITKFQFHEFWWLLAPKKTNVHEDSCKHSWDFGNMFVVDGYWLRNFSYQWVTITTHVNVFCWLPLTQSSECSARTYRTAMCHIMASIVSTGTLVTLKNKATEGSRPVHAKTGRLCVFCTWSVMNSILHVLTTKCYMSPFFKMAHFPSSRWFWNSVVLLLLSLSKRRNELLMTGHK